MSEGFSKVRKYFQWGTLSGAFALAAYYVFTPPGPDPSNIDYSTFLKHADQGYYSKVTISGTHAEANLIYGKRPKSDISTSQQYAYMPAHETTEIPLNDNLFEHIKNDTKVYVEPAADPNKSWRALAIRYFPFALLIGAGVFLFRSRIQEGRRSYDFMKSKAKLMKEYSGRQIKFDDVAGIDEVKEDLQEIVDFLRNPRKFESIGAKMPKGILLSGPPGVGKTLLAKAVAGEANVPFFSISGSDFVEIFVGVGASRVRDMFEEAKKNAPCIVFIDEIDAVGRSRGKGQGGSNDEREQTLNQLLVEMDGFEKNENIILIAATNRPDILDKALLRPGRFDRQIEVPNPEVMGRAKILAVHAKKIKIAPDVNLTTIARGTSGFSGADLANIVNEAALLAARRDSKQVTMQDFEQAKDKMIMGVARKSAVISDDDKLIAAYYQAGRALVIMNTPDATPLHKVSILPRGQSLGKTSQIPEGDQVSASCDQIDAALIVSMGGRVAEELQFGKKKITSMAADDVKKAGDLARKAVTEWGMSDKLGPVQCGKGSEELFAMVDQEVRSKVCKAFKKACQILTERRNDLDILANALLTQETMTADEIRAILQITHELDDLQQLPQPA